MECESTDAQNGGWNFKLSLGSLEPSIGGAVEMSSLFLLLLLLLLLVQTKTGALKTSYPSLFWNLLGVP